MAYQNLLVQQDGAVCTVTVNRPQALNALDPVTLAELLQCSEGLRRDPSVRCVILTGAGAKAFVAGADIAAMVAMSALEGRAFACHGQRVMHALEDLPVPVIAAVNGFALGGGMELALACDLVIASQTAKFGQPEINLGIIPGFGGTQRLARRIGAAAARLLIYSGDMVDADEALRLGLVNRVVAAADLMAEVQKLAAVLAAKAPVALQQAKAAINVGVDVDLRDGCRYEAEAFAVAFGSDDRTEGMRAFLEKRRPNFRGR
ncbi:MAG: enoyl-CoA hydratase/carnithine racemase [Deltaproteobacteria bacterium]|nr:enoyl-CoA hydratase/carnithine racemase [Deltaproteobacteria bacterium]